ncbi:hypothetical protein JHK86_019097 [Glycine max]|nr:hypothetical protein JHK86_019097 [Glycine max]
MATTSTISIAQVDAMDTTGGIFSEVKETSYHFLLIFYKEGQFDPNSMPEVIDNVLGK